MTDTFDFDAKAGNRAGRRLRRALGNIGQALGGSIGRGAMRQEPFDPRAEDGDGDGIVQDGSIWARPAGVTSPSVTPPSDGGDDDTRAEGIPRPQAPDAIADTGQVVESKVTQAFNAERHTTLEGRSPEEIAELIVPADLEELNYQREAFLTGDESRYESTEDYLDARDAARELVESQYIGTDKWWWKLTQVYQNAFKSDPADDALNNPQQYSDNLISLLGIDELGLDPNQQRVRDALKRHIPSGYFIDPDFRPETIQKLRQKVADALRANPELLEAVQKFGSVPIFINHPRSSPFALDKNGRQLPLWALAGIGGEYGKKGKYHTQGMFDPLAGNIHIDAYTLDRFDLLPPVWDGVSTSDSNIADTAGFAGLLAHEWSHYFSHSVRRTYAEILRRLRKRGDITAEKEKQLRELFNAGLTGRSEQNGTPVERFFRFQKFYSVRDAADTKDIHMAGRLIYDLDNPENSGFATFEELQITLAEFLLANFADVSTMLERQQEIQRAVIEANKLYPNDDRKKEKFVRKAISELAKKLRNKDKIFSNSDYGNSSREERLAESFAAALIRMANTAYPAFTNDFTISMIAKVLGMRTEPNGVQRMLRRDRRTQMKKDISDSILSTIRLVADGERRGPDGRRIARLFRVDREERSTLRSARSDLNLDTDIRLYSYDEPVTISDFRNRPRAYSIGNYRFYDRLTPNAHTIGSKRRMLRGRHAGKRYLNPGSTHHDNLVRGVSSTLMGFFVDDIPLKGFESDNDLDMLRGFVTGNIAGLPYPARERIENAVKDAIAIGEAVQVAERSNKQLYRTVDMDPDTVINSISKGDVIPLPITSFTDKKPKGDTPVVLVLRNGAKVIEGDTNEFLTQGNYKVVDITDDGRQFAIILDHVETFDPRHDAMRPVDRFADQPGAMRKRGTNKRRYTRAEQSLMTADLTRRRTAQVADRERINLSLRSQRDGGTKTPVELVDEILLADNYSPSWRERVVDPVMDKVRSQIASRVTERLTKAGTRIRTRYGTRTPWIDDKPILENMASISVRQVHRLVDQINAKAKETLLENNESMRQFEAVDTPHGKVSLFELTNAELGDLTKEDIRKLIETGEVRTQVMCGSMNRAYNPPGVDLRGYIPYGWQPVTVKIDLSEEDEAMLKTVLEAMDVVERMYGSGASPKDSRLFEMEDGRQVMPNARILRVNFGSATQQPIKSIDIEISGNALIKDPQQSWGSADSVAAFKRVIKFKGNGRAYVHHSYFESYGEKDRANVDGIATLLNQHAFLWYRQIGASIDLEAATDGPIVWPRLGFSLDNKDLDALERFTFEQIRYWRDGRRSAIANDAMAIRLATWLRLYREGDSRADIRLLANMLEFSGVDNKRAEEMREEWRSAFSRQIYDAYTGGSQSLNFDVPATDDNDFDDDFLPSFVISDEEMRFIRDAEVSSVALLGEKKVKYLDDEAPLIKETASRLAALATMTDDQDERRRALLDQSGYNIVPQLATPNDLERLLQDTRGQRTIKSVLVAAGLPDESIRALLFGAREPDDENLIFRSNPTLYPNDFRNPNDRFSDPATEKRGVMAVIPRTARVKSRLSLDQISGALNTVIRENGGRDGLVAKIKKRFGYVRAETLTAQRDRRDRMDSKYYLDTYKLDAYRLRDLLKAVFELEDAKYPTPRNPEEEGHNNLLAAAQDMILTPDTTQIAVLLGVDVIQERDKSGYTILNRGAVHMVDEPMSLTEMARAVESARLSEQNPGFVGPIASPHNDLRNGVADWWKEENPTLLRAFSDEDTPPIDVTSRSLRSSSFIRNVRQDFGIDLERRGLRSQRDRTTDRAPRREMADGVRITAWDTNEDPAEWTPKVKSLRDRVNEIENEIDRLEAEQNLLYTRSESGTISKAQAKLLESQAEEIDAQIDALREEQNTIIDTFASMVETSNGVLDRASQNEAMIVALRKFIEETADQLPSEYGERAVKLLNELEALKRNNPVNYDGSKGSIPRKRHALLAKILDENFDIRWGVENETDDYDPSYLELFDRIEDGKMGSALDDDLESRIEAIEEYLYRGFFDPNYEGWDQKNTPMSMGALFPESKRQENPLLDSIKSIKTVFAGATNKMREGWAKLNDRYLNDQPNADYQESLIDATPAGASAKPTGIPYAAWRKIRAAIERAKRTPYDGEREASYEGAKRIIARYRPDLANDDYVVGLRSSRSNSDLIRGVPAFVPKTRGSDPATPRRPRSSQTNIRIAEKMKARGFTDFSETDVWDGESADWIRSMVFKDDTGLSKESIEAALDKDKADKYSADEIRALMEVIAEMAVEDGMEVIKIEGHTSPKVLGPIRHELIDVLVDDADIAMFRALGSPTYEQIINAAAYQARRQAQLNAIFGRPDSSDTYKTFLSSPYALDDGDNLVFHDAEGNMVMRVSKNLFSLERRTEPSIRIYDPLDAAIEASKRKASANAVNRTTTERDGVPQITPITLLEIASGDVGNVREFGLNQGIYESMRETAGLDPLSQQVGLEGTLEYLRGKLKKASERIDQIEFAPTPAGRHMAEMFRQQQEQIIRDLEILQRVGERQIELLRQSGLDDAKITEVLENIARDYVGNGFSKFNIGSAVVDAESGAKISDTAYTAFARMVLNGPAPIITEGGADFGTHELAHFGLGQAFTRHGEFVANFWTAALYGDAFWERFADSQLVQRDFDAMTIKEHFGLKLPMDKVRPDYRNIPMGRFEEFEEKHDAEFRSDIINAIQAFDDLTDEQKRQAIALLPRTLLRYGRGPFRDTETLAAFIYDIRSPLPLHLFGWTRSTGGRVGDVNLPADDGTLTPIKRQEFGRMLQFVLQLRGRSRFFGEETPEDMILAERTAKAKGESAQLASRGIIDGINRMLEQYPELRTAFSSQLDDLGL